MFARGAQGPPGAQGPGRLAPHELAAMGRFGDSIIAHLTPGEIEVPPQLQNRKVLAVLDQAFRQRGVKPEQFTAGSPEASKNPKSGQEEFNLMASLLPLLLGVGGSLAFPMLAPALGLGLSSAAAGAIGGGLGSALGTGLTGGNVGQSLAAGAGAGLGSYFGGGIGGGMGGESGGGGAGGQAPTGDVTGTTSAPGTYGPPNPFGAQNTGNALNFRSGAYNPWTAALGAAGGGLVGQGLVPPTAKPGSQYPPGFLNNMTPTSQLGTPGQILGSGVSNRPNFAGYNPFAAATGGGFSFY